MLSPEDAEHAGPFQERKIEWQSRNLASRETDHQMPSTPRKGAEGCFGERSAYGIEDHIGPLAPRQFLKS